MFGSYYWEHIVAELRSQAKLASEGAVLFNDISRKRDKEATDREKQTVEKITQSIDRIKEQHSKLNRSDSKAAALLTDSSDHFEVIRSGDYYMFDYESDEKEDEEKQDEATVAQEQILQVITARDKHTAVAAAAQKPSTSSFDESDSQEFLPTSPIQSPLSPAITTTTEMIPSSTTEQTTSVEPKESEESQKSVLFKICLIGQIVVDYSIDFFKRNSRDYREVSIQLYQMKTQDKNNQHEERTRSQMNITTVSAVNLDNADFTASVNNAPTNTETHSQTTDLDKLSRLYRFFDSLIYYIMSRSELVCYSAMVINHLTSGSILSMPLPLSIFLWAMLPSRPSRNYWITIITYTEAMIVVKYIFQFRFYPWNASEIIENNPLSPVNIIGINRRENAASAADLFLLLSLFFHRSILKQLGLWKAETVSKELNSRENNESIDATQHENQSGIKSSLFRPLRKLYIHLSNSLFRKMLWNILLLALSWSLGQGIFFIQISITTLAATSFTNWYLATIPIGSMLFVATVWSVFLPRVILHCGYRPPFYFGALMGMIGAGLCIVATWFKLYWLLIVSATFIGGQVPCTFYYRLAGLQFSTQEFASKAIAMVTAGGCLSAFIGPEIAKLMINALPKQYSGAYLAALCECAVLLFIIRIIQFPDVKRTHNSIESILLPTSMDTNLSSNGRSILTIVRQRTFVIAAFGGF
ncbi:unnamed protein product, partial [Rotaria sp. Silwood2]